MKLGAAGEEPKKVWNQTNQRPGTPSVLVGPEKLFLINNAGVLTCASRRDGTVAWEIRLKGPFSGSPVAGGDGKLYIFNEQGVGQVVDTNGEKGVVTSEIELGETILSTPALDGKALYIRSDGYLWKFAAP
jgi:outer membrane protein assembly factor BamB